MDQAPLHEGKLERAKALSSDRAEVSYDTLGVTPVNPVIGAEIEGVDMTKPVSAPQIEELNLALASNNVLFFHDQPELTPEQQIAFARNFGDLHFHPAAPKHETVPELFVIHTHGESVVNNGADWHSDVSCDETPPMGTLLQIHKTPARGGDTLFANMYAAYDALSEPMKGFLSDLTAIHDPERAFRGRYADKGVDDTGKVFAAAEHPIVRTHPLTRRQALFVNRTFTTRIRGLAKEESDTVLEFLFDLMEQPRFQVRFQWTPNAIAFWDNRCTQHLAMWDYWPQERKGHRVTIKGDKPYYSAV